MRLCAHGAHEGGSKPSYDLLCDWEEWGGHTLFGRMQTPRLMDGHSGCFPGFRFIREIVTQLLREAEERAGLLFGSGLDFSWIQDAMKRLRVQPSWQSFEERWSKSPATAVPSPNRVERCRVVHKGHIWCNQKHRLLVSLIKYTPPTHTFKHVCHQR